MIITAIAREREKGGKKKESPPEKKARKEGRRVK